MSIGTVMFFKALVLGLCAIFAEWWKHTKEKRFLTLRKNKHGVYQPDDRMQKIENIARKVWIFVMFALPAIGIGGTMYFRYVLNVR